MASPEPPPGAESTLLLRRFREGDEEALGALIQRHLPWLREHVRRSLKGVLRDRGETTDYVHDAMVEFLRYAPRFEAADEEHFKALLARVVRNVLCNRFDWFNAQRRRMANEVPLAPDSILQLDPPGRSVTRPSSVAHRADRAAWTRLGMELLEPDDREVVLLRSWEELSFEEIGARKGINANAARMRFQRALGRLGKVLRELRGSAASEE